MNHMKFAFTTTSCPAWDFETILARAREYGYGGIEIRGFLNNDTLLTATNVFLADPLKVRGAFQESGIEIACLSSSIAMAGDKRRDAQSLKDLKKYIDTAAQLGCPLVKVFDAQVKPGRSRAGAAIALGDWLTPMGDYAAEHGITIVIENALSFRSAKEMWMILDRLNHPSIACCWDIFNAAMIGEQPAVSVPTLNSRIQYVQVKDATFGSLGSSFCKIGEGDVPIERFITRLRGIGYAGWVTMEWEKTWLPNLAEPEEILPDAVKRLKEWANLPPGAPAPVEIIPRTMPASAAVIV